VLCQAGVYRLAARVDNFWLMDTPAPARSVAEAVWRLMESLVGVWVAGTNEYDKIQWACPLLLRAAYTVFLTVLATANVDSFNRMCVVAGLSVFSAMSADALTMNVFAGMFFADLSLDPAFSRFASRDNVRRRLFSILLVGFGLYLASYPWMRAETEAWSAALLHIGTKIFPAGRENVWYNGSGALGRFIPGIGIELVCFGIMISPKAKELLSSRILVTLGGWSIPIYLLQMPLSRTLLLWMSLPFSPGVRREEVPVEESPGEVLVREWWRVPEGPLFTLIAFPQKILCTSLAQKFLTSGLIIRGR